MYGSTGQRGSTVIPFRPSSPSALTSGTTPTGSGSPRGGRPPAGSSRSRARRPARGRRAGIRSSRRCRNSSGSRDRRTPYGTTAARAGAPTDMNATVTPRRRANARRVARAGCAARTPDGASRANRQSDLPGVVEDRGSRCGSDAIHASLGAMDRHPIPPRVLVTGFEPFDRRRANRSWQWMEAFLRESERSGLAHVADLAVAQLPVDFVALPRRMASLWKSEHPDAWILTGECGRGGAIRVERVALNLLDARIPDNAGRRRRDAPSPGAVRPRTSRRSTRAWRTARCSRRRPAELSLSAGSYCCNQAFYVARHLSRRTRTRVIFLHIPRTGAGRGRAAPRLDDAARGLASLVRAVARVRTHRQNRTCPRRVEADPGQGARRRRLCQPPTTSNARTSCFEMSSEPGSASPEHHEPPRFGVPRRPQCPEVDARRNAHAAIVHPVPRPRHDPPPWSPRRGRACAPGGRGHR